MEANTNLISWIPTIATLSTATLGGGAMGGPLDVTLIKATLDAGPINMGAALSKAILYAGPINMGAALGLITASVDEILISQGYTDYHALATSAFWSANLMHAAHWLPEPNWVATSLILAAGPLASYATSDFLDFRSKILMPANAFFTLNQFFDPDNTLSTATLIHIYETIQQSPSEGWELLKHHAKNLWENHFIFGFGQQMGISLTQVAVEHAYRQQFASYASMMAQGLIQTFLGKNEATATSVTLKAGTQLMGVIGSKQLIDWGLQQFAIYASMMAQGLIQTFLGKNEATATSVALKAGTQLMGVIASKQLIDWGLSAMSQLVTQTQYDRCLSKSTTILLENDHSLKLLAQPDGSQINNNLLYDIWILLSTGVEKINGVTTQTAHALMSLQAIQSMPTAFTASSVASIVPQSLLGILTPKIQACAKRNAEARNDAWDLKNHISDYIEAIAQRDGLIFAQNQYNQQSARKSELATEAAYLRIAKEFVGKLTFVLDSGFALAHSHQQYVQESDIVGIAKAWKTTGDIQAFLVSNYQFQVDTTDLQLAQDRVNKFFEIINTPTNSLVKRTTNDQGAIELTDYTLKLDDKVIVHIDELVFEKGGHYAITGSSGCGKTTTLIDIKLGVFGAMQSTGTISMPDNAAAMMLNQKLYLPYDSTLLESICFPTILTADNTAAYEARVIDLMKALEIDEFFNNPDADQGLITRLYSKEFKLSGGQEKKVGVIQAILKKPEILIMDETFAGLDPHSLKIAQKLLAEHLPTTTFLVVDHEAMNHNDSCFYNAHIHFGEGKVTSQPMPLNCKLEVNNAESIAFGETQETMCPWPELDMPWNALDVCFF